MQVLPTTTFREIQDTFSKTFPGLKIEFFKSSHGENEGSSSTDLLDVEHKVNEVYPSFTTANVVLAPNISVAEFEQNLKDTLGINAQVYRRSKELWLQTISTDHWTLEIQNRKGIHSLN